MIAQTVVALGPVIGLIALGYAIRTRAFLAPTFWPPAERLCYFILLPALFVNGTATADLAGLPIALMAPILAGPVILTTPGIAEFVRTLGIASLPLGLLCVGAALELRSMGGSLGAVALATVVKFVVMPALGIAGCLLFGLTGKPADTVILFLALPTASSAYVMARARRRLAAHGVDDHRADGGGRTLPARGVPGHPGLHRLTASLPALCP